MKENEGNFWYIIDTDVNVMYISLVYVHRKVLAYQLNFHEEEDMPLRYDIRIEEIEIDYPLYYILSMNVVSLYIHMLAASDNITFHKRSSAYPSIILSHPMLFNDYG